MFIIFFFNATIDRRVNIRMSKQHLKIYISTQFITYFFFLCLRVNRAIFQLNYVLYVYSQTIISDVYAIQFTINYFDKNFYYRPYMTVVLSILTKNKKKKFKETSLSYKLYDIQYHYADYLIIVETDQRQNMENTINELALKVIRYRIVKGHVTSQIKVPQAN